MADTTIYPYGTDGQLPSDIGIVNDLVTGGADKALSAEQGKRLAPLAELIIDKTTTTSATFEEGKRYANYGVNVGSTYTGGDIGADSTTACTVMDVHAGDTVTVWGGSNYWFNLWVLCNSSNVITAKSGNWTTKTAESPAVINIDGDGKIYVTSLKESAHGCVASSTSKAVREATTEANGLMSTEQVEALNAAASIEFTIGSRRNLYNPTNILRGYWINVGANTDSSQGLILGGSGYVDSDAYTVIPVEAGKPYIIYHADGAFGDVHYAFLSNSSAIRSNAIEVNGKIVQNFTKMTNDARRWTIGDEVVDDKHRRIIPPTGCIYLAINVKRNYYNFDHSSNLFIEQGNYPSEPTEYENDYVTAINGHPIKANDNERERGYDIPYITYLLGDSIVETATARWPMYLASKYSIKDCISYGLGGATWGIQSTADWSNVSAGTAVSQDDNCILTQVYKLINNVDNNNYPEPELVFILAGTNDVTRATNSQVTMSIGEADDVFDFTASGNADWSSISGKNEKYQNMCGGIRVAIETLRRSYPYVNIIIATPLQRNYSSVSSMMSVMRNAVAQIKKSCGYLSVPVMDLNGETGIYSQMTSDWLVDGVHPYQITGDVTAKRLADYIGNWLMMRYGNKPYYLL